MTKVEPSCSSCRVWLTQWTQTCHQTQCTLGPGRQLAFGQKLCSQELAATPLWTACWARAELPYLLLLLVNLHSSHHTLPQRLRSDWTLSPQMTPVPSLPICCSSSVHCNTDAFACISSISFNCQALSRRDWAAGTMQDFDQAAVCRTQHVRSLAAQAPLASTPCTWLPRSLTASSST